MATRQQVAGKATFNRPGFEIFDFNVYAMCSDGDLMEARLAGEAASLAGHFLKLSNLCWIYDHNHITLDGPAKWSFTEDVATRFVGYEWNADAGRRCQRFGHAGERAF